MITPNALILTGCVCIPIATCAFVRVCVEWLDRIDEDRRSQKMRDAMTCEALRNTERSNEDIAQIAIDVQYIKAAVEKLCEELGIDLKKKD